MKKSVVFAIIIGILVGTASVGVYLWSRKKTQDLPQISQQETQTNLLDWKDPNGFSFQYPEGVAVNKHDEDTENYAHIEMTHPQNPGSLIVWGKDTTAADVSAWVKTEKSFREASIVDTTLGGQPAKKILISSPTKKVIVGTIFDEILWFIEVDSGEDDYWQKTLDTIAGSFKFIPLAGEASGGDEGFVEEVAVDEEEVIE